MNRAIDIEEYLCYELVKKAEVDYLFTYLSEENDKSAELLQVSSVYLKTLSEFQSRVIEINQVDFDDLNIEQKLRILSRKDESVDKEFIKLYLESSDSNLKYDKSIRDKLISLNLIEVSLPLPCGIRPEFALLKNALSENDLNEIYMYSYQISNYDFKNFTEQEKDLVLDSLKICSEGVALAIGLSLINENKISYGKWIKFWKTLSQFKPGDNIEENLLLYNKSLCLQSDYGDERIDMSMFPNLPTIYEDGLYDSDIFITELDWSQNFEPYEIDFILAVALSTYNEDRSNLIEHVNRYLSNRSFSF